VNLQTPSKVAYQPACGPDVSGHGSAQNISEKSGRGVSFPGMKGSIWGGRVDLGCQIGPKAGKQIIGGRFPEAFPVLVAPPWG